MKALDISTAVLLLIVGINWGLVGLLGLNPIAGMLGMTEAGARGSRPQHARARAEPKA